MKLKQLLITTAALFICFQIAAQDFIYRNNGKSIKARILDTANKSLSYKLYELDDSITYFINTSIVDSIIYQDGKKETFIKTNVLSTQQSGELIPKYNHNLIGADFAGFLLYKNLIISYEYLPGKARLGYKIAFAKNMNPMGYYVYDTFYLDDHFDYSRILKWNTRIGLNYYFFQPRTFRVGTGMYYIFGSYTTEKYTYNEDYTSTTVVTENKKLKGLMLSLFGFYNFNKNLAMNLGFDAPLSIKPSSGNIMIRTEILFNF